MHSELTNPGGEKRFVKHKNIHTAVYIVHSDSRAIKAFKKGVLYHGEDCNRGPKNDPPILEPAFLLVNR